MSAETLNELTARLLDPETPLERDVLLPLVGKLQEFYGDLTGIRGEHKDGPSSKYLLPNGLILPFQSAATCLLDPLRTIGYMRALEGAIHAVRAKFPDQPAHVLYAGTGPYAPFAFAMCTRFSPAEVRFTLVEFHEECVQSLLKLTQTFGFSDHIPDIVQGDATSYNHEGDPFHICVVECMQKALTQECQVAITNNLAPQLHPEGYFIPDTVTLDACLAHPDQEFRPAPTPDFVPERVPLGELFRLDRETYKKLPEQPGAEYTIACPDIQLPDPYPASFNVTLFTRIRLFEDIVLNDFQSGLTVPYMLFHLDELRQVKTLKSEFRVCRYPGLYFQKVIENQKYDPFHKELVYPAHGVATGM